MMASPRSTRIGGGSTGLEVCLSASFSSPAPSDQIEPLTLSPLRRHSTVVFQRPPTPIFSSDLKCLNNLLPGRSRAAYISPSRFNTEAKANPAFGRRSTSLDIQGSIPVLPRGASMTANDLSLVALKNQREAGDTDADEATHSSFLESKGEMAFPNLAQPTGRHPSRLRQQLDSRGKPRDRDCSPMVRERGNDLLKLSATQRVAQGRARTPQSKLASSQLLGLPNAMLHPQTMTGQASGADSVRQGATTLGRERPQQSTVPSSHLMASIDTLASSQSLGLQNAMVHPRTMTSQPSGADSARQGATTLGRERTQLSSMTSSQSMVVSHAMVHPQIMASQPHAPGMDAVKNGRRRVGPLAPSTEVDPMRGSVEAVTGRNSVFVARHRGDGDALSSFMSAGK